MEVLGLIPARGGSTGIPGKNLAPLAGKPLLAYTCEQALAAKELSRVVLSSDDERMVAYGKRLGVDAPFLRPPHLAEDDTPMIDVVRHALDALQRQEDYRPEAVVLLQPTSPLRRTQHIDEAVRLLRDTGADSVVSVVEVPHQFTPSSLLRREGDTLVPYLNGPQPLRRQDKPVLYARNGPAVLAVRTPVVLDSRTLYGTVCRPLVMSWEESVDIDGPEDLEWAERVLAMERLQRR